ncbi:Sdc1 protein [Saccharomycopsis crataegensis]|uniref:Sdc1 protein n=1 Tax=Saccharomycopsis crataegensis TaxID=43959 RepID=A0AAV5QG68_9ASCO|nr:Sdc1 protein [Saccharomycopsis crataegensis]
MENQDIKPEEPMAVPEEIVPPPPPMVPESIDNSKPIDVKSGALNRIMDDQQDTTTSKTTSPAPQSLVNHETSSTTPSKEPEVPQLPVGVKPSQVIGGAPFRQWLNEEVTPYLLEGMRQIANNKPEEPLKYLAEFLLKENEKKKKKKQQKELEG